MAGRCVNIPDREPQGVSQVTSSSIAQTPRHYTTFDGRVLNAVDKAKARKARAMRLSEFTYMVKSQRPGHAPHIIEVTESGLCCDCESASYGKPCFHAACVGLRLQREHKPEVRTPIVYAVGELFDEDTPTPAPVPQPARPRIRLEDLYPEAA